MRQTALFRMLFILVTFCVLISLVTAQEVTGSIRGTVTDSAGAVISGATVTVANTDRNAVVRTLTTNPSGSYVASYLPIGHYSITVDSSGFQKVTKQPIEVNVNDKLTYDFTLTPGATQQIIDVSDDQQQVQLEDATSQSLISGTQIRELSINNRNYEQLIALAPGVSSGVSDQIYIGVSNPAGTSNQVNFSINGGRPTQNNFTVDGADNVDRGANLTLLTYPSVDAISEFKVLRGQYNAEYGRSSSGQINVITRSGESKFHGSLYEFFRNDVFNANTYFDKHFASPSDYVPRGKLRYNDFGGTFGGPLFIPHLYNTERNKTFFFFSEEARRIITYSNFQSGEVPTAAELTGNFSAYGPVCLNAACSATGTQIPVIDPTAQAYIKDIYSKLPTPNFGDPLHPQYQFTAPNVFNSRQEIYKVDHVFNQKYSASFKFENDVIPTVEQGGLFTGSGLPGVSTTNTNSPGRNLVARATLAFTPTLVNEVGYAHSTGAVLSDSVGLGATKNSPDINPALPFPNQLDHVPTLSFNDGEGIFGFGPYRDFDKNDQVFDNLTKVIGRHTLKFGGTYNFYQKDENASGNNNGSFSFLDSSAAGTMPNDFTFQQEFANFLEGNVNTFSQTNQDFHARLRQHQFELYAQDTFRLRRNFTLSYGVRYSYFHAPYDASNQLVSFDPSKFTQPGTSLIDPTTGLFTSPTNPYLNGLIIANQNSPFGRSVQRTPNLDFAPRIGFAWDPTGTGKTSVRAGYGIFYDSPAVNSAEQFQFSNPPFVIPGVINNTNLTTPSSGSSDTTLAITPNFIGGPTTNWKQPYTQEYSLDIQQDLGHNFLLDVGYYGSQSKHLIGVVDVNQPLPGAYLAAGVAPYPIKASNTILLNSVRPFVGFDAINLFSTIFGSNYNSLQTQLQKRFSNNSLLVVNYTYSHALTDSQSDFRTPQNTYDIRAEYGEAQFDRRHVLTADYVYTLPALSQQNGFVRTALGSWEVSGIVTANSGLPLTATNGQSIDPAGLGVLDANSFAGRRPNQVGDPNLGAPNTVDQWFNTAAFPKTIPVGQVTPGDARRGSILGPGLVRWDASLFKNFKFTDSTNLQFRAEAFNVLNHTNFDGVSTSRSSSLFGKVTSTRDPRILQLALKFYF